MEEGLVHPESSISQMVLQNWPSESWKDVHVGVAISGGCDSIALLRILQAIKQKTGGEGSLFALHVNHQLRGEESEHDAVWCQQQCEILDIPLTILTGTAAKRAEIDRDGLEAAARAERYELLTTAAENLGARYLAFAHTQNDQVETILFRILRGSGLRGLTGIPFSRQLTNSLTLVRPLLDCRREDLEKYLSVLDQSYRDDSSNCETTFTRNRLRHELLPQLRRKYGFDVDSALLRLASQAKETQSYLEQEAQLLASSSDISQSITAAGNQQVSLALEPLSTASKVVVCEALRSVWRAAHFPEQAMTYEKWQLLTDLALNATAGRTLNLPGSIKASIADGRLFLLQGN